jgi:hypothetical protein
MKIRAAVSMARKSVARGRLESEPTDQDIVVLIIYFYQGETTLDVDNITKSLLDGLKGVLFRGYCKVYLSAHTRNLTR